MRTGAATMLALAAVGLAVSGCGSRPANRGLPVRLRTGTAPDGNPYPLAKDLRLPASGLTGIRAAAARPGDPRACAGRGASYVEARHLGPTRRLVALTFDDGPSEFTARILSILERRHVRATFFVIGEQVADHPELLRRQLRDGDMIGDHTWTHADMTLLPADVQRRQLQLTVDAVRQATGFQTCIWRAPYGAINAGMEQLARGLGLNSIQWDTDPQDFTSPPAAAIVHRVLAGNPADPDPGVHPGAIVLMHDGGGDRRNTVAALPSLITGLRARGYRFVTVPELLGFPVRR